MQYNKQQFNKVNDKKIMKKVKKQWVVVSIASLAVLGGFAVSGTLNMSQPASLVVAHADSKQAPASDTSTPTPAPGSSATGSGESTPGSSAKGSGESTPGSSAKGSGESTPGSSAKGSGESTPGSSAKGSGESTPGSSAKGSGESTPGSSAKGSGESTPGSSAKGSGESTPGSSAKGSGESTPGSSLKGSVIKTQSLGGELGGADSPSSTYNADTAKGFNDKVNNQKPTDPSENSNKDYQKGQDLANQNQDDMNRGAQDAINGNKRNSSYATSPYYNNSYDGANQARLDYDKSTEGQGTSTKDYTSYNNTVQPSSGNDSSQSQSAKIKNPANVNKSYGKQSDGTVNGVPTGDNSDSYNSITNSGGADNPTSASNSTSAYDEYLKNKFNSTDQGPVANANDPTPWSAPTKNTGNSTNSSIQSDKVNIPNNYKSSSLSGINSDIYSYGYKYFLAHQGALDYESGKWKGTYYGKDTKNNTSNPTSDFYLSSNNDPSSAYYQGYIGAGQAISNQWNSSNQLNPDSSVNNNADNSSKNTFYNFGYDDVAKQVSNTAFVSNGTQFDNIMQSTSSNKSNIRLVNDINLNGVNGIDTSSKSEWRTSDINNSNISQLNIDGQNHIADLSGREYFEVNPSGSKSINTLNVKNFKTIYGSGYFGPFVYENGGNINYSNINYVGVQLLSATSTDTSFSGNNNISSVTHYTSPFNKNVGIDQPSQQNLQVQNMTLAPNANYFGDTNFYNGGSNLIEISSNGTVTLGKNSNMTLLTGGTTSGNTSFSNGGNYAISMDSSSNLVLNNNANLNIAYNSNTINGSSYASGIYNKGNIDNNGGNINIEFNGDSYGNNALINSSGSINIHNGGLLQVKLDNSKNAYSNGLVLANAPINVYDQGNLVIKDLDNDQNTRNLVSGSITADSIGPRGIRLQKNDNSQYTTNGINASNVSLIANNSTSKKDDWYYTFKLNSDGSYTYNNDKGSQKGNVNTDADTSRKNSLNIYSVPTVNFNGPISTTKNADGSLTVNGFAKINNYNPNAGDLSIEFKTGNNNGTSINPQYDDLTKYGSSITKEVNGNNNIPFSFTVNENDYNNLSNPSMGVRLTYGATGNDMVINLIKAEGTVASYSDTPDYAQLNESKVPSGTHISSSASDGYNAGLIDAQNNNSDKKQQAISTYNSDSTYQNAYDSAKSGYNYYGQNSTLNLPTDINKVNSSANTTDPNAFSNAYNQHKIDISTNYDKGIQEFRNSVNKGNLPNNSTSGNTDIQHGYNDTKSGYNLAMSNPGQKLDNPTKGESVGFDYGKDVITGANSATDPNNGNNAQEAGYKAAQLAQKQFNEGQNGNQNLSSADEVNVPNPVQSPFDAKAYQNAYYGAYRASQKPSTRPAENRIAQNAYDSQIGINYALSGNNDPTQSGSSANDATKNAYLATRDGITKSNDKPDLHNSSAYQIGSDARQGAKDAIKQNNQSNAGGNYANNAIYMKSYQAAQDGFNNPKAQSDTDKDQAVAYDMGKNARQGADAALAGKNNDNNTNPSNDSDFNNAYQSAKHGLNDPQGQDESGDDANSQAAYNMGKAAQKGISDAQNDPTATADSRGYKDPNSAEAKAYNAAKDNFKAGMSNSDKLPNGNAADTNGTAYQAGLAAKNGIDDAEANNGKQASDHNYNNPNSAEAKAYAKAKTDYNDGKGSGKTTPQPNASDAYNAGIASQTGLNDAMNGNSDNKPQFSSDPENQAYTKAHDNYQAGVTGKPTANNDKNSDAYKAGQAAKNGINDAEANNGKQASDHNYNDPNSSEAKAYAKAKTDYNDGKGSGKTTPQPNKSDAYNSGIAAQTGLNDAIDGNDDSNHFTSNPEKQAYENAKNNYDAGIGNNNGENADKNSDAYKAGQAAQNGLNDIATKNGKNVNNYSYAPNSPEANAYAKAQDEYNAGKNSGSTTPQKDKSAAFNDGIAAQAGINDAKNGTDNAKNFTSPSAKQAYQNAQIAYNAGNNGDTTSDNAKKNYDANQNGYNNYLATQAAENAKKQNQQPAQPQVQPQPSESQPQSQPQVQKPVIHNNDENAGEKAGKQAFVNGSPMNISNINFAGKSKAFHKAFSKAYNNAQLGFSAGMNGNTSTSNDPSYKAGYKSAQDYQKGVKDATRGKKPANNSDAYKVGYEAYKNGESGKRLSKRELNKLAPAYRTAYKQVYDQGHKKYVVVDRKASKAARTSAMSSRRIPRNFKHESQAYKDAYMKAFNEEVKRNLPSYVYNLRKIYSHDAPALTRKTRVKKYAKTPRYARHAFKVLGYKITSSGHVVYKVKGLGWISASDKSVDNLYYRRHDTKKPIQKIRVIKPEGTYIYDSKTFNKKTAVKKMKRGSTVNVERIERVGGITRFYIGDGKYISSNKTIVEHVH
ncbi:hypothetical protein DY124_04965 [Apilactobacillus micheneri]|uniref:DUF5776 domain-containing protein n=1 Tax=Apilactobacillus micheneri TaxID=1899430 RepID=UPI00112C2EDA|nr:DUF5776 domain-containing protein [Apilactobacillus micheneri]TPR43654.1 hypothetical protein DY124_04965 [Apilactobacillus micheneri]TPR47582.1 hypothetical protein DY125_04965 [Apilactobacillus micheneri]